jgi:hypothetical protein
MTLPPALPPEALGDALQERVPQDRSTRPVRPDLGQVLCDALENDITVWPRLDESDKARYKYAAEVVRRWLP